MRLASIALIGIALISGCSRPRATAAEANRIDAALQRAERDLALAQAPLAANTRLVAASVPTNVRPPTKPER